MDEFRFRRFDSVGDPDAERDLEYLTKCFVDTGDIAVLRDCSDQKSIVVGRTGSGKSALLIRLKEQVGERAIEVKPEALALEYISNSDILRFVQQIGVTLDPFFKLLWRHVFVVELLKTRFHLRSEEDKKSVVERIRGWLKGDSDQDKRRKRALDYLDKHGPSFWIETELRTREVTRKLEQTLEAEVKAAQILDIGIHGASKLSEDERADVVHRVQHVVNAIQIRELSEVLDMIDGLLDDPQKPYYIIIDRLDERWVEDEVRYKLIRALLEVVRDFFKIRNAKLIVALRRDLIERVFRVTRDPGFQEEKYRASFIKVAWSKNQLAQVLDKRIGELVRRRYTKAPVTHCDVLPDAVDGTPILDYLIKRTLMRPRDIIEFFNACISKSIDQPRVSIERLKEAEGEYSRDRLRFLADEWSGDYPNLACFATRLLKKRPRRFRVGGLADDECVAFCTDAAKGPLQEDSLARAAWGIEESGGWEPFRREVMYVFYVVGLVGLKIESYEATSWATEGRSVSRAEIDDRTRVEVHPCFWRALGIRKEAQ